MLPIKRIAGFFLLLLFLYGLLIVPWPGLQRTYTAIYRAAANSVFGSFGPDGKVRFRPLADGHRKKDTEIVLYRRGLLVAPKFEHSALMVGYLPTIEVVALILATPIPWFRRCKALLWGMFAVHAFIFLRLGITLVYWFSMDEPWALFRPSPFWSSALNGSYEVLAESPMLNFAGPVFIWILVTFRRSDVDTWCRVTHPVVPSNTRRSGGK